MANSSWDNGGGKPSSEFLGSMPNEAGPAHARSWVWNSSADTEASGEVSWDEDSSASAATIEEKVAVPPAAPTRAAEPFPRAIGLEESGDYDLAPLRHLLEQDWADPRTARSNVDYQRPQSQPWHQEQAEVDTMELRSARDAAAAKAQAQAVPVAETAPVMALPSEADFPDLVFNQGPPMPRPPIAPLPSPRDSKGSGRLAKMGAGVAAAVVLCAIPFIYLGAKGNAIKSPESSAKPVASKAVAQKPEPKPSVAAQKPEPKPSVVAVNEEKPEPPVAKVEKPTPSEVKAVAPAAVPVSLTSLNWSGLPNGSKVFWQGQRSSVDALGSVKPGNYSLKVIAPSRPAVLMTLKVEESSDALPVGEQVKQAIAKQPTLSLALAKTPKAAVSVRVRELGTGATFKTVAKLTGKNRSSVVLPKAGKYKVEVTENSVYQDYGQTVSFDDGSKKSLQIALKSAPIPVASAPAAAPSYSGGGGGGYSPPPTYSAPPPPTYYSGGGSGGGGGGGGRIAPPSF